MASGWTGHSPAISTHALREEGDALAVVRALGVRPDFYPRPPRGGRHLLAAMPVPAMDFYPRPPRGGRPARWSSERRSGRISTHALREEGDLRPT